MQRAGKRNVRVRLERLVSSRDDYGGTVKAWTPVCTVWAGIRAAPGAEKRLTEHGGPAATGPVEISIVYRKGIDESCRAVRGTTIYQVHSVINVGERNEMLTLTCESAPAGSA